MYVCIVEDLILEEREGEREGKKEGREEGRIGLGDY